MSSPYFVDPTFKDKFFSTFFVLLTLLIIILSGFFILENYGIFLWFLIVFTSIFLLVKWHSSTRGFKCTECGHEFSITFWQDLPTASSILFMKKMLRCPKCEFKDYATEVIKKKSK
jgi:DNA-directed RNA polymerase subunit RPC12/RpoP